jgi:hypothetical protein
VYEGGAIYDPKVLDIQEDDLMDTVQAAIARVAAASLELNYPTLASIPHSVVNGYKNVLAVSVATDYDFPLAEKVRGSHLGSLPDTCGKCLRPAWWILHKGLSGTGSQATVRTCLHLSNHSCYSCTAGQGLPGRPFCICGGGCPSGFQWRGRCCC